MKWLTASFNNHALFEVQHTKFKLVSQNPGERVHAYNIRWNLERELVDELTELYPAGTVHEEELENMYVRSLLGPFSSKLTDLRAIRGTLNQVVGCTRDTTSEGCVSLGLKLLQKHAVQIDNDHLVASELRKSLTHLGDTSRFSELADEHAEDHEPVDDNVEQ